MAVAAIHTFEAVARTWLKKIPAIRAATTQGNITTWLQKDVFPFIGNLPASKINWRMLAGAEVIQLHGNST